MRFSPPADFWNFFAGTWGAMPSDWACWDSLFWLPRFMARGCLAEEWSTPEFTAISVTLNISALGFPLSAFLLCGRERLSSSCLWDVVCVLLPGACGGATHAGGRS